jgi:hypothetical protein
VGISSYHDATSSSHLLDARNVIASGEIDIRAIASGEGLGNTLLANSNFDTSKADPGTTITDAGGNQSATPLFVNAATGDYREAVGSPTIDAGSTDQIGTLDFDGNSRAIGAAPDIGAYEFVPPPGEIQSLALAPRAFRPLNAGGAIFSAKGKSKAPIGATVTYSLSGQKQVEFFVERKLPGRRVRGKCRKATKANRHKKRCARFRLNKNGFAHPGVAGQNRFKFSGRVGGRALKPGAYRLVGMTKTATLRAPFRIVK